MVHTEEDAREFRKGFRPDLILTIIRDLRAWRRRRRRRLRIGGILRVERGEIKELRRLLIRSGIPLEEVSPVTPVLLRCLVQSQREMVKFASLFILGIGSLVVLQICWVVFFKVSSIRQGQINNVTLIMLCLIAAIIFKLSTTRVRRFERALRYDPSSRERRALKYFWTGFLLLSIVVITLPQNYVILLNTIWQDWVVVLLQVSLVMMYAWLAYWLTIKVLRWRAPELILVRALADAFEITAEGGPASWRSISRRGRVAQYIDKAADALEGPIARKFVRWAGWSGAAPIQEHFLMAGAALRSKIAWLATPKAETRDFLARALGKELLIAARGDLDQLEYLQLERAELPSAGWLTRLRRTLIWAAFAFGPGIIVLVVSKWQNWVTDPGTISILWQFSVIWLITQIVSVVDPTAYKDKLSSVTSTGTALFGWRRTEKHDT